MESGAGSGAWPCEEAGGGDGGLYVVSLYIVCCRFFQWQYVFVLAGMLQSLF